MTLLFDSVEDLLRLQRFLGEVIAARAAPGALGDGAWYVHLRDRERGWTSAEADVILAMVGTAAMPTF